MKGWAPFLCKPPLYYPFTTNGPTCGVNKYATAERQALQVKIKNPSHERRGIEDFSLKSLRMWGTNPPHRLNALKGGALNRKRLNDLKKSWNGFYPLLFRVF
ncbi:MAG: hypothetical protein LBE13_04185 [Bacteroidales bacterium]|jgi:hypothetical protein|nr:hypothetical protein [Bacteroidales bacterium]